MKRILIAALALLAGSFAAFGQDAFRNFRKDFHTVQLGGEGSDLRRLRRGALFGFFRRFLRRLPGRKLDHGQR